MKQHLIDPEVCIRCNTCEETCPIDAITHDSNNYVVDATICNHCMACVPPCPTGAIDNWLNVLTGRPHTLEDQFSWEELPPVQEEPGMDGSVSVAVAAAGVLVEDSGLDGVPSTGAGSSIPPWSAAQPQVNLYTHKNPVTATVVGNYRVTDEDTESDIRHIVLDFGAVPFPVLEGQSIAIFPPGTDSSGRAFHARQYSIASPRDGERPRYNNLSLTVKRVMTDSEGNVVPGICSNYLCDLKKNDTVQVIGPFGSTFLMPNHPEANIIMICTGTGSAPMRAMTERCRRQLKEKAFNGKLMLFFGARTQRELPYFGPLMNLPADFIDINLALSREPGQPKRYVQDLIRERSADVVRLLDNENTSVYVCGLKGMEEGVLQALESATGSAGGQWAEVHAKLKAQGRLHVETY
ncbi:benzoyl-CoA 2,3-epoxidase subunit BoxA [Pollutimonas subterranea]|nr:benzoyl-CoA 2,3-epoxidase subunit BoxA [Pollutimonas subterranea]